MKMLQYLLFGIAILSFAFLFATSGGPYNNPLRQFFVEQNPLFIFIPIGMALGAMCIAERE